jgi:predicted membrane channel-forming protein YqfA (hemolysin III family)
MRARKLDLIGAGAALVCLIHCLFLPLLLTIQLGLWHNAYVDLGFFFLGALVVFRVTKSSEPRWLRYMFWVGIGCIGISILLDLLLEAHSPLMYLGALLLITANLINIFTHKH